MGLNDYESDRNSEGSCIIHDNGNEYSKETENR